MLIDIVYFTPDGSNSLTVYVQVDPYIGISDEFQVLVKQQKDAREYGSPKDNKEAAALLSELHSKFNESEKIILNILVENLSNITMVLLLLKNYGVICFSFYLLCRAHVHKKNTITYHDRLPLSLYLKFEADDLLKQLSEEFTPDEAFMFGPQSMLNFDHDQGYTRPNESPSLDGVCFFNIFWVSI